MIRTIQTADIAQLHEIRIQTAAQGPFGVEVRIEDLLASFPQGQILFEQAGRIVGFALSQRIDSSAALRQVSAAALPPAHAPTGHALLLLACAAPSDPVRAALLAALRALAQRSGIGALALVGWCMHAQAQSAQDFHGYLATALRSGWTSEPALEAHVRQGARVLGFIEDYRPAAAPHFGYGVLLEYEIEAVTEAPQPLERRMRAITRQYPEVVPLALTGEGPLTFWIHPMSGDVGMYNRLAARMGGAIRMIGLRARGFLVAERAPIADLVEMARYYAECIVALEPHGPYHLAGFSVGGTIAYEVARQLQLQGKSVRSLVMVEAPLLSEQDRPLFQSSARNNLLVNANFLLVTLLSMDPAFKKALENREVAWKDVQIDDSEIADVADADVLGRLVQLCLKRDVKLSADEVAFKLASMADVHMANLQATQRYQGERLPRAHEVNAFVFRTREGKVASSILRNPEYIERVQAAHGSLLPLLTAWSALLPGLSTVLLDGDDHFDILRSKEGMQKFCARCIEIFGAAAPQPPATAGAPATEAVAIIGMSGRFPGAPDVHRFWDNLKQGVSSIAEAPSDRGWHIDQYFDPVAQTPGKSYSKWGGFLSDVDQFDPLFFGIAPREAEVMDPSERIFLQECWRAIEDAGYAPARISGRPWGVFATAKGDYAYHIHKSHDTYLAPTDSSGPARVSYLLNLVGPAVSVDTACSSTLTAVAYACDSLVLGNCEVAIAGGGGIYSTPNFFVASSQSLLFSPDGVCAPFDHRANGTVMGEAVGVVVLKLLKHALRDGDPIHGVIRGWATNQDGKTNGMTAPSVTSQTRLQSHVYKKFGIDCARIGMVESHGTGTRLGDPIEVQALTASFREATAQVGYCALGAVKGNIGHAFAGAGVTALIKTLLCLKHGQIPPNLNFEKPNPFVKIDGSPFYINTELRDWPQGQGPRCAAINSFGATGINAHLVVEEFTPGERACVDAAAPALIVLSAKSADRLEEQARQLLEWVRGRGADAPALSQVAATLQLGRNAMEERLGLLVRSFDELEHKLAAVLAGQRRLEHVYAGRAGKHALSDALLGDEDLDQLVAAWMAHGQHDKLLRLWAGGHSIDWTGLYRDGAPRRVHLPTYPFAGERYWYTPSAPERAVVAAGAGYRLLHPLLHTNTSDLSAQKYSSTFDGAEFFLADHVVHGRPVLPGVAYLEMARAAACNAACAAHVRLTDVVWARPITLDGADVQVQLTLAPTEDAGLRYEVLTGEAGAEPVLHSRGGIELVAAFPDERHDLAACIARCQLRSLSHDDCYRIFDAAGIAYGRGHRIIERLLVGRGEALAELVLPQAMAPTLDDFVLHPGLADAALQACIGLLMDDSADGQGGGQPPLLLPFALRALEVRAPCTQRMWAIVTGERTRNGAGLLEMNIDLCDHEGRICARLTGFSARPYGTQGAPAQLDAAGTVLLAPAWSAAPEPVEPAASSFDRHVVLLCDVWTEVLAAHLPARVQVHRLASATAHPAERFAAHALAAFGIVQDLLKQGVCERVLVQVVGRHGGEHGLLQGLLGLLKTAALEHPSVSAQWIGVDADEADDGVLLATRIMANAGAPQDRQVRYQDGQRQVLAWHETAAPQVAAAPWRDGGVYLFTGGAGALGLALAREAAQQVRAPVLVLAGRSEPDEAQARAIAALGETGAQVSYRRVDVTDAAQVTALLDAVRAEYGAIDGIVHLAGITRDRLIVNKGADEVAAVLAPKVAGLVNLDQASSGDALGFFLLFSSLAGVTGNPGQADYALANAFLDAYAGYRNSLVESGQRQGRTIAINWPLWADGGMQPAHGGASGPAAQLGLAPMDGASGMQVLAHAFTLADEQLMVMHGDVARIRAQVLATPSQAAQPELQSQPQQQPHPEQPAATLEHTIDLLKRTLAEGLKVAPHKIDPDTALDQYGVDSILSMELTTLLEKTFGQLPKTLFFEYLNVRDLAGYFISEHAATLQGMLADAAPADVPATVTTPPAAVPAPARATRLSPAPATRLERAAPEARTDIAIIGMAGRFPGARDLDEFWENLKRGQDNITEVPPERWDSTGFFDASGQASASSYCKWGGFMEGVDQFDPLFFNISPREAALIDPQERLFLETSWELMEGAGYTREALRTRFGSRVGVYVGAMYQQYHAMQSDAATEAVLSLASYSAIANRVSHFFGLQGPSLALDTMCSSAFTAIHLACESLRKGECEMAIAGGINLSIHPKKYVGLAQARIIGSSPASRSFANGDGYLPAEGVGAVLLKPLDQAERDGDIILAVIKGSAINHTGQTQHFGVPNPNAQAQLIAANFARTGIDPSTVSYVEAAANGSPLGDAIEMQALAKVFGASAGHGPARPIGSVKSNIGHAEAASGMSQLAKVILQMRHGQIAPTLQTDALNPNIRFDGSPFVLATQLAPWTRPVVTIDGAQQELARRAIINAFGAGGSNGHLLVEEYRDARAAGRRSAPADPRQVLLLSARSEASLQRMAHKLKSFLEEHDALALEDIAYTLQIGREAMDCRLALVVTSRAEAILGLERFLTGAEDGPGSRVPMFIGQNEDGQALRELFFGSIGENLAAALMRERHPDKLALYWAYGGTVDWALLHQEQDVRRVALPTYAFERQRYWVESGVASTPAAAPTRAPAPPFTDVAATLAALIGIGADQLKLNKPLAQYGVDSIGMMQLLAHLQAQGHAALEPAQLMACRTPQDIVALVGRQPAPAARRAASALATAWPQFPELVRLNGVSEGTPVFWFHAGMGGVEAYQGLAQRSARPFFGIQARGWGSARAPLQGVQAMAAYYTHIICQVWPEGPCDLGGYSLGGLLAYEVTRQLQELGRTVNSIVMLDSPDAHALRGSRISPKTHMLRALNTQLSALVGARLGGLDQILIHRDEVDGSGGDEAFLDALLGHPKLRRLERPAASLRTQVLQHVRAQSAYQLEQTVLAPLARPDEVRCYYFRNRGGVFLGALEPYFLASGDQDDVADNYWDEWTGLLPALSITDVDASNHMSLLAEERAFEPIARLCHALYAQDGAGGSAGAADPLVVEQDRI